MTEIVIPYTPREQQLRIHAALRTHSRVVVVAHRRLGKTVAAINELIRSALLCRKPRPRYGYIAPFLNQARNIAWDYLKHYSQPLQPKVYESESRIDFYDRRIRLFGADNPDFLRGLYFDGVVLDEPGQMRESVWSQIILPALVDRKGWALFIGTPAGKNFFFDLAEYAKSGVDPEWAYLEFKASETGLIPQSDLDALKVQMDEDEFEQEFEASFTASVKGSYYGRLLDKANEEGRVGQVPYDPALPVETWWDLGVGDATAIWFVQRAPGGVIRVIDYYESSGEGLPHYLKVLASKTYFYGRHVAPHDINVRELGTGRSRLELAQSLGIRFDVAPRLPIEDGIEAVRTLLPRCWFDAIKCARGLDALRHYRKEWDEKRGVYRTQPVHDWASHGADAFRYGATARQVTPVDTSKTWRDWAQRLPGGLL